MNTDKPLRVLEMFAGIGACSKALTNLGIPHEIVDAVEIDRFAIKSFNAIHGTDFEPQDITKWDKPLTDVDLLMHGSPCQDFSTAGKQAGGDEGSGTRSSLLYETLRIVESIRPRIVLWENVKGVLSKKHRHNFDAYQERMAQLGYTNYYQVLNAKDFGVPQNRERVFTVSILKDVLVYDDYNSRVRADQDTIGTITTNAGSITPRNGWKIIESAQGFKFPTPRPLTKRLKDLLEPVVDEHYYLSGERLKNIKLWEDRQKANGRGFRFEPKTDDSIAQAVTTSSDRPSCGAYYKEPQLQQVAELDMKGNDCIKRVYSPEGVSPTLTTMGGGQREPKIAEPFIVASRGRNPENPSDRTAGAPTEQRLEPKFDGTTNTLTSVQKDNYVVEPIKYRIRKLTPRECWRLQAFSDEDVDKVIAIGMSKTQMYKQAGNSICVAVLEAIFKELFRV